MTPTVGQTWSILLSIFGRTTLRIARIEDGIAYGTAARSGRVAQVSTSVLEKGQRGAYLVADECGTEVRRPGVRGPRSQRVTPKARAAVALLERGVSRQRVAIQYGVSENSVRNWARLVRLETEGERPCK